MALRLKRIKIHDVLGIESFEADVSGKFIQVVGDNGAGKSSFLKALEGTLGSGSRADLIRIGAKAGETVLVFDNDYELTAKFGVNGTNRKCKTPEGATITAVQAWLEQKFDRSLLRPIDFVEASADKRIEMLLSVAPLSLEQYELEQACGKFAKKDRDPGTKVQDPLGEIEEAEKRIYDLRTGINRSAKDKRTHIAELERTIPPGLELPPETSAKRAEYQSVQKEVVSQRDAINMASDAQKRAVEVATRNTCEAANQVALDAEREARAELVRKLAEIEAAKAQAIANANAAEKGALADVATRKEEQLTTLRDQYAERLGALREEMGRLDELEKAFQTAEGTRAGIRKSAEEAKALETEADEATATLRKLELLRASLLEQLPVPGLEIKNGQLLYRGVPYESTNTAEQIDVAMHLALAGCVGDLKLILLDGLERLGAKKRAAIEAWASNSDCQFIVTRVQDNLPLTVTSETQETA